MIHHNSSNLNLTIRLPIGSPIIGREDPGPCRPQVAAAPMAAFAPPPAWGHQHRRVFWRGGTGGEVTSGKDRHGLMVIYIYYIYKWMLMDDGSWMLMDLPWQWVNRYNCHPSIMVNQSDPDWTTLVVIPML